MPEDLTDYRYRETVVIGGNVAAYLKDLGGYFRHSLEELYYSKNSLRKGIYRLNKAISSPNLFADDLMFRGEDNFGCPFEVNRHNIGDAKQWIMEEGQERTRLVQSQRINVRDIEEVLKGNAKLEELDLINYARAERGVITRMKGVGNGKSGGLLINVFFNNLGYKRDRDLTRSFADNARHLGVNPRVTAEITTQENIDSIPNLSEYVNGRRQISRLRIKQPAFRVLPTEGGFKYELDIIPPYDAMLAEFKLGDRGFQDLHPSSLYFHSQNWSDNQGRTMLTNLFGILALWEKPGVHRNTYSFVYVPKSNQTALKKSFKSRVFTKEAGVVELKTLLNLYQRAEELRKKCPSCYPRFSAGEMANRTGLAKEEVKKQLIGLTGILAESTEGRMRRWFLPRARTELAIELFKSAELI